MVWLVNFVLSIALIELLLFVFEIRQNYTIIVLKVMWRKQTSVISQLFTCQHKINKSNAKVTTHYQIICLYSKNFSFYVFIPNKFCSFFRNILNTKTIKINKQSNVCLHLHIHQGLLRMPQPLFFYVNYFLKKHH